MAKYVLGHDLRSKSGAATAQFLHGSVLRPDRSVPGSADPILLIEPDFLPVSSGTAETAIYSGGSRWAHYWIQTVTELRNDLIGSGKLDEPLIEAFPAHCADPGWWTQTIAFTAVYGRAPIL